MTPSAAASEVTPPPLAIVFACIVEHGRRVRFQFGFDPV